MLCSRQGIPEVGNMEHGMVLYSMMHDSLCTWHMKQQGLGRCMETQPRLLGPEESDRLADEGSSVCKCMLHRQGSSRARAMQPFNAGAGL